MTAPLPTLPPRAPFLHIGRACPEAVAREFAINRAVVIVAAACPSRDANFAETRARKEKP